ncbi:MAG: hydrogenase expression/formation C-terminal domain-containing protein [Hyphomicrobium sp.]
MTGHNPAMVGPGTQPPEEDGAVFDYMEMPKGMRTYSAPALPEPEEVSGIERALTVLAEVRKAAETWQGGDERIVFEITGLDAANRAFIDQALGDGEVSIVAGASVQAQESVLAGIWRVHELDERGVLVRDSIEVGAFPGAVLGVANAVTLEGTRSHRGALPPGVLNAPALVTELDDRLAAYAPDVPQHVINLTLLPLTEEDVAFLDARLGPGSVTILSRGYGNCRISSTGTRNAWWVRYFNSRDAIVLNTIEVVDVPSVACAAPEDIADSAQRLGEILGVYQ